MSKKRRQTTGIPKMKTALSNDSRAGHQLVWWEVEREMERIAKGYESISRYTEALYELQVCVGRIDELSQGIRAYRKAALKLRLEQLSENLAAYGVAYKNKASRLERPLYDLVKTEVDEWLSTVNYIQDEIDLFLKDKSDGSGLIGIYGNMPQNASHHELVITLTSRKRGADKINQDLVKEIKRLEDKYPLKAENDRKWIYEQAAKNCNSTPEAAKKAFSRYADKY